MTENTNTSTKHELLTIKMRYKKPKGEKSQLIQQTISHEATPFEKTSENCQFSAAVAEFALILRDSKFKKEASYEDVLKIAKRNKGLDKGL